MIISSISINRLNQKTDLEVSDFLKSIKFIVSTNKSYKKRIREKDERFFECVHSPMLNRDGSYSISLGVVEYAETFRIGETGFR